MAISISWNHNTYKFYLNERDLGTKTLRDLKDMCSEAFSVPADAMKLVYCGGLLKDDQAPLASFGITLNTKLLVIGSAVKPPEPTPSVISVPVVQEDGPSPVSDDLSASGSSAPDSPPNMAHRPHMPMPDPRGDPADPSYYGRMPVPVDVFASSTGRSDPHGMPMPAPHFDGARPSFEHAFPNHHDLAPPNPYVGHPMSGSGFVAEPVFADPFGVNANYPSPFGPQHTGPPPQQGGRPGMGHNPFFNDQPPSNPNAWYNNNPSAANHTMGGSATGTPPLPPPPPSSMSSNASNPRPAATGPTMTTSADPVAGLLRSSNPEEQAKIDALRTLYDSAQGQFPRGVQDYENAVSDYLTRFTPNGADNRPGQAKEQDRKRLTETQRRLDELLTQHMLKLDSFDFPSSFTTARALRKAIIVHLEALANRCETATRRLKDHEARTGAH
ncbi:hypothetical protein IWQ60_003225 [Tieghemiomyces parasiticus]|uniref:Ubiquitin-like domain-containing protein n=1 Tax=Tieghemiomyces parasiticus TaxID=78921 RepID=A0A9W8E099_9FUNG|nr:hypothetical protein IWQ60_003225 [Tieghemiomyces parasiticus]